jgi:hypothetical protein
LEEAGTRGETHAKAETDEGTEEGYSSHPNSFLADVFGVILPTWVRIYNKEGRVTGEPCPAL